MDTGATWAQISEPAIEALLAGSSNAKISVGAANNVYVAICGADGSLAGLFRSGNGGMTWSPLDLPRTIEAGGVVFGLHPGGQASIHLSIAADRNDPDIVYVGRDRQTAFNEGAQVGFRRFPNSIGARDFSGRRSASMPVGRPGPSRRR